jgi:site-specific recombinase XerD
MDLDVVRAGYLNYSKRFKSEATYKRYDTPHLNIIVDFMINNEYCDSDDLDYHSIYDFIDASKLKENSNKTINKRIELLKRAIMFFVKRDMCSPSIVQTFPKLKEIDKRFDTVDEDTMKDVIKYLLDKPDNFRNIRNQVILFLFIDSGARLSEVTNIKTNNIDHKYNAVLLNHTKAKRERMIHFSDFTHFYIKKYLEFVDDSSEFLFRNSITNEPITYLGVLRIFQMIKKDLHLEHFSSHMIRHTYGTLAYKKDINEFFTNRTMGHSRMDMTRRYTHMDIETNSKMYKKLAPMEHYVNKK